ncbi:hypothetical protein Bca52824_073839 [Brassica carinata]|uniref:Uncharacterized protein n=1 Tax=Brassica carinata TaxID=52824 RepID=A0A8X7U576_BRACI|nr:hypothetical protein Bca52824_073839 [Brassica carinata]
MKIRVYRSSRAKESLIRAQTEICHTPHWLIAIRDNHSRISHAMGVVPPVPRCEAFATAFGNSTFPPATAFNMGAVLAANLAGYKGKVTNSKSNACGFGAVITRILRHVGVDCKNQQAAVEFLPPATALVDKPSFFTPKYQTKGKGVVDEEGEDEAAQAIP